MTLQIWTGSSSMTSDYKKSTNSLELWKNCIILQVHKTRLVSTDRNSEESALIKCHVSYLDNPTDEDETIEKWVEASRLRLILGSDELTPSTIDEARLALLGGEEVTVIRSTPNVEINENTGLSGWTVSSVRKTTVNCELKQERLRLREIKYRIILSIVLSYHIYLFPFFFFCIGIKPSSSTSTFIFSGAASPSCLDGMRLSF